MQKEAQKSVICGKNCPFSNCNNYVLVPADKAANNVVVV